jgi:uncharacterized membrane protein
MYVDTRLVIGPNASLDGRGALWFMGALSATLLGVSAFCAWRGLWLVFPFAGLEILAVGAALAVSLRRNRYREVIEFAGERVRVEFGLMGRGAHSMVELPRGWTRVLLERSTHRNDPTRLVLASSGQRVEIGRCLTDEDRERIAARVRELLRLTPVQASTGEYKGEKPERSFLGDL